MERTSPLPPSWLSPLQLRSHDPCCPVLQTVSLSKAGETLTPHLKAQLVGGCVEGLREGDSGSWEDS